MQISFLCSDALHPVNPYLEKWIAAQEGKHQVEIVRKKNELAGGTLLFLISCSEIIGPAERAAYKSVLVLHASDLPRGRGWSPHIWQILENAQEITLSLLEAEDQVDSGRIWKKIKFAIPPHALWDEINVLLFEAEIELIDFAVHEFTRVKPLEQDSTIKPNYYIKRTPADSKIDPQKSIADQFNQIRVCDPNRFPAFFELHGKKYKLTLEKIDE